MSHLNFVPCVPDKPEQGQCPKHGAFDFRYQAMGDRFVVLSACSLCAAESAALQKKIDQQAAAKAAQARLERSRIDAGVPIRFLQATFSSYKVDSQDQALALHETMEFTQRIKNGGNGNLILSGRLGTGKTMLASAMVCDLIPEKKCRLASLSSLVRELKDCWGKGSAMSEASLIKQLSELDLLIIDEVGQQRGSETEILFVSDVIDGRYKNMLPTVLISNLDKTGIREAIGDRAFDRLRQDGGKVVAFNWGSMRSAI
jgi:DNA replication protein DnaC